MMVMTLPTRKIIRLNNFEYNSPGAYFITICTHKRENLFWMDPSNPPRNWEPPNLSPLGNAVKTCIENIPIIYPHYSVDHYVIMPNHIHLLLCVSQIDGGRPMAVPTVSTVINQFKGAVSKCVGKSLWQPRFHYHIIRSDSDYLAAWNYIDGNPSKWFDDDLYIPS